MGCSTPWSSFVCAFGLVSFWDRLPCLFFNSHLNNQPLLDHGIEVKAISGDCMIVGHEVMQEVGERINGLFSL